ncbi:hypothetical protein HAX54_027076 [Datura stramonium]|uniref:Uncharacterized protein n=1 Tax=Datura stramonium TaxID=4076 RepID=A0ABS8S8I2_DATST|nr:hypothetical protein [Datura stramonium]
MRVEFAEVVIPHELRLVFVMYDWCSVGENLGSIHLAQKKKRIDYPSPTETSMLVPMFVLPISALSGIGNCLCWAVESQVHHMRSLELLLPSNFLLCKQRHVNLVQKLEMPGVFGSVKVDFYRRNGYKFQQQFAE